MIEYYTSAFVITFVTLVSFVILLQRGKKYHIIVETLDTEETTYIWHFEKTRLKENLNIINKDLNTIRNKGRQFFIENTACCLFQQALSINSILSLKYPKTASEKGELKEILQF